MANNQFVFSIILKCLTNISKFTKVSNTSLYINDDVSIWARNSPSEPNAKNNCFDDKYVTSVFFFLFKSTLVCFIVARSRIRWRGRCRKSESGVARRRKNGKSNSHDHKFQGCGVVNTTPMMLNFTGMVWLKRGKIKEKCPHIIRQTFKHACSCTSYLYKTTNKAVKFLKFGFWFFNENTLMSCSRPIPTLMVKKNRSRIAMIKIPRL